MVVEVSANGQQYTSDQQLLTLHKMPTFGKYSPSTGAGHGNTLVLMVGTNLRWSTAARWNFNGSIVNATYAFVEGSDARGPSSFELQRENRESVGPFVVCQGTALALRRESRRLIKPSTRARSGEPGGLACGGVVHNRWSSR